MVIAVLAFVVFMERALRKIHIQYPRRQVGMKVYDGGSSHLPIKVNPAGVIPRDLRLVAAAAADDDLDLLRRAIDRAVMSTILAYFGPGQPLYLLFFTLMIVFFTYFYTRNVAFKTDDVADNLKNQNGFVPGIRPGKKTEEYLDYVVNRILVLGSGLSGAGRLLPEIIRSQFAMPFYFGGTSVLIVVSVGDGHDQPDPIASAGAPVRRADRKIATARQAQHDQAEGSRRVDEYHPTGTARAPAKARKRADWSMNAAWCNCRPATCCARPAALAPRWASASLTSWTVASWSPTRS